MSSDEAPKHPRLTVGLDTNSVPDLNQLLDEARQQHFDFVAAPLVHPRLRRDCWGISDVRTAPLTRSDTLLDSRSWGSLVVGKVSEWIDLDAPAAETRKASEQAFKQELAWASHLSMAAVLLPLRPRGGGANYARCLNQVLQRPLEMACVHVWVHVPVTDLAQDSAAAEAAATASNNAAATRASGQMDAWHNDAMEPPAAAAAAAVDSADGGAAAAAAARASDAAGISDPWQAWNRVRLMCEHRTGLSVALELTADLPEKRELDRWLGEPVRVIVLPTNIFITNRKGYPTLSKRHQMAVTSFINLKVQFMLKGRPRHPEGFLPYMQYLEHLSTRRPPPRANEAFEAPYTDYLQSPLQPLMDNLESQTYESFEKDPVKYSQYEKAIAAALRDMPPRETEVLLMVVGAGRGPLVRAALSAARSTGRRMRVYAVEKNPNAVVTLRNLVEMEQWDSVTIVPIDMREWEAPELADILVSELLGSFGDNELSPECLDGAQRFLKPGGVSIPQAYTSFMAPISSHKLWREVANFEDLRRMETAFVVKMHNFCQLAEEQPCFYFAHPNADVAAGRKADNRRYHSLRFDIKTAATLHGFAGYFHSQLYGEECISIVPSTFSDGMFSWFPLYFPLRHPVTLKVGDVVETHLWRCCGGHKVWYEWALVSPQASPIHNPNGRSYWIGL